MIQLVNEVDIKTLNVPTDFGEITKDYIEKCSNEINLAPNHVLICIVYKEQLSLILSANKNPANVRPSIVIPILAKDNANVVKDSMDGDILDKCIISGADLSRGYHVNCKNNELSIKKVCDFVNENDALLKKCILGGSITNKINKEFGGYCYFTEFKIVPLCDIKGVYKDVAREYSYIGKYENKQ